MPDRAASQALGRRGNARGERSPRGLDRMQQGQSGAPGKAAVSPHAIACLIGFFAIGIAIAADLIWVEIMESP
jgi:hypothetical protein